MTRPRTVGVLGGMGPAATWDFCTRLLAAAPAARDQDHPRVLVDCDPAVPDRNAAAAGTGPSPGPHLARMARGLEVAGADLLCMPCNAAHGWADEIRAATRVPFVDMVQATARAVAARVPRGATTIVLATEATRRAGLYEAALRTWGLRAHPLDDARQERLTDLIYGVKAGDAGPAARAALRDLLDGLDGACVVSACTEVPLLLDDGEVRLPVVASTEALAREVAELATRT